jgi:hypothetical protein
MKTPTVNGWLLIATLSIFYSLTHAQTCPASSTTSINSGNLSAAGNTYFSAAQATVNAGSSSIVLGPAGYGSTPISPLDILLIIQMQGAEINSGNGATYGSNGTTGRGYLNNAQLMAGNMEFIVATNSVPVTGGTLNLKSALTKSYKNSAFGTYGQYSYQVIRVPLYYQISMGTDLTIPDWNGSTGGALVLATTDILTMNGHQINATGAGFRGGGGKSSISGSGAYTDLRALSTANAGASKGEGIAGMPRYINSNGALLDNGTTLEGYPNGSFDRGSPGNAGGGGTDGLPSANSNNSGGGGGSNGGVGGGGGNSWSSNRSCGGIGGATFAQVSPSRLVMGGGGGAGSTDGGTGTPNLGFASSGTAGGGIVILNIGGFSGTGIINANGDAPNTTLQNDGAGGAGAGGSVLIVGGGSLTGLTVHANGANGASNTGGPSGPQPHGPGGGGGGGVIYSTGTLNAGSTANGGAAGTTTGGVNYGATAGAAGLIQVTASTLPAFPVCTVLAANFLSASVSNKNNNNMLNWTVADDAKVQQYNIERSDDGFEFVSIATILPQSTGNNNKPYQYTDADAATRINELLLYYRIKLVQINGHIIYSKVMQVKSAEHMTGLTLTPNPVADLATLYFLADNLAAISVQVLDLKGKSVWKKQYTAGVGINMLPLNNLQALPDGVYIVHLTNGKQVQSVKMLVRH